MGLIQEGMQVSDTTVTGSTSACARVDTSACAKVDARVDTTVNFGVDDDEDTDDDKIIEEFFGYNPNKIFLVQRIDAITGETQILYYVDAKADGVQIMTALLEKEINSIDLSAYKVFKSLGSNGSVGISTQKIRYAWNGSMMKRCTYEVSMINKIRLPQNSD